MTDEQRPELNAPTERLLIALGVGAVMAFVGLGLESSNLIDLWLGALLIAATFLFKSPIRNLRPFEKVPERFGPITEALMKGYTPKQVRERNLTLGIFRAATALAVGLGTSSLMQRLAGTSFVAGLAVMFVVLLLVWFVVVFILQKEPSTAAVEISRGIYHVAPNQFDRLPVVKAWLLGGGSRFSYAVSVGLVRASVAVLARIAVNELIPFINGFWIVAASIALAMLIAFPDRAERGIQRLSEDGEPSDFSTRPASTQPSAGDFAPPAEHSALSYQQPDSERPTGQPHVWVRDENGEWR